LVVDAYQAAAAGNEKYDADSMAKKPPVGLVKGWWRHTLHWRDMDEVPEPTWGPLANMGLAGPVEASKRVKITGQSPKVAQVENLTGVCTGLDRPLGPPASYPT
jgi:hypothetical protein